MPFLSAHAVTVPGAAAGWVDTVEKLGSGKVSLEQVLTPAIELAENGFPVSEISGFLWKKSENLIKTASPNGAEMLKKDSSVAGGCRAPGRGEIMKKVAIQNAFSRFLRT